MNEQRRQHYLRAMGIESYVPRMTLPGAARSVACEHIFDEEFLFLRDSIVLPEDGVLSGSGEQLDTSNTNIDVRIHNKATTEKITEGLVEPSSRRDKQKEKQKDKQKEQLASEKVSAENQQPNQHSNQSPNQSPNQQANPTANQNANHQFHLGVWRVGDDLLVIDTHQPHLALPTEKLLFNIVRALGYSLDKLPKVTQLRSSNSQNGLNTIRDDAETREMVEAFLSAEQHKKPFSKLLLMGNQAAKYVLPEKEKVFNFNALVSQSFDLETADVNAKAIVVPSLTVLLQKPKFKSITWQSIQSFRV